MWVAGWGGVGVGPGEVGSLGVPGGQLSLLGRRVGLLFAKKPGTQNGFKGNLGRTIQQDEAAGMA